MINRHFNVRTASLVLAGLAVLTACEAPAPDLEPEGATPQTRTAVVTSAFVSSGRAMELVFLPNEAAPWTGMVASSLAGGGFDIFSVEGETLISASGPQLLGMTGIASFSLRGESFPLLFGIDELGALRGFAVVRETREVIELPLEMDFEVGQGAGICLYNEGIGFIELAVLDQGASAQVVRIRDTGGVGLTVTRQNTITLPFPARSCAPMQTDLLVAGPTAGLARINAEGDAQAFAAGLSVSDVAYTELQGRPVALVASSQTGLLTLFDARTLEGIIDVEFEDGLSAPAITRPSAITVSASNYGGMAYSSGLMAVYDEDDSRIKLVAREVLTRTLQSDA